MSALDLAALPLRDRTLAGRVIVQVLNELRLYVARGITLDADALNIYEGAKVDALKIREPAATPPRSMQPEESRASQGSLAEALNRDRYVVFGSQDARTLRRSGLPVLDGDGDTGAEEQVNVPRLRRDLKHARTLAEDRGDTFDRRIEVTLNLGVGVSVVVNVNTHGSPSVGVSAAGTVGDVEPIVGAASGVTSFGTPDATPGGAA